MDENLTIKYYTELKEKFNSAYSQSSLQLKKKHIHDLRVSIKKLRVFWKLISIAKNHPETVKPLKRCVNPLFKSAGYHREAQINLGILKQMKKASCKKYKRYQKDLIIDHGKKLNGQINKFDIAKFNALNDTLLETIKSIPRKKIESSIDYVLNDASNIIMDLRQTLPNNEHLHEIRSQLRIVREMMAISQELGFEDRSEERASVKRLYEKVGDWHDIDILIESRKDFGRCKSLVKYLKKKQIKTERKLEKKILQFDLSTISSPEVVINTNLVP